jgi:hypothetical protein
LRGCLSPAWPAHAAQAIPGQSQVVQLIMFASLYFVGQAKMSSCLCSITQPGQSIKALANMWANSLQPAKLRPEQPCSRDTTFSVVSPGPGRGTLFGCRGTGSLAGQRRKHGKLHAASAAGLQSRPRKRALRLLPSVLCSCPIYGPSLFTPSFSFVRKQDARWPTPPCLLPIPDRRSSKPHRRRVYTCALPNLAAAATPGRPNIALPLFASNSYVCVMTIVIFFAHISITRPQIYTYCYCLC